VLEVRQAGGCAGLPADLAWRRGSAPAAVLAAAASAIALLAITGIESQARLLSGAGCGRVSGCGELSVRASR